MCLNFSRWSWRIPRLFLLLSARPLESTQAAQELQGKQHELLSRLAERGNSVGSLEDFYGLLPPPLPLPNRSMYIEAERSLPKQTSTEALNQSSLHNPTFYMLTAKRSFLSHRLLACKQGHHISGLSEKRGAESSPRW